MPLTSYPFSLLNISAANTATTSKTLSVLSTTANATTGTASQLIKVAPYAMSEFLNYTHTITSTVTINGTNAYWGKGSRQRVGYTSGNDSYIGGAQGSIASGSPLTGGWNLSLSVQVAAWIEHPSSSSSRYAFEATSSSSSGLNTTWWNKVTISRSGYSDLVLTRASASVNSHSNYRMMIAWVLPLNYITGGTHTWTFSNT